MEFGSAMKRALLVLASFVISFAWLAAQDKASSILLIYPHKDYVQADDAEGRRLMLHSSIRLDDVDGEPVEAGRIRDDMIGLAPGKHRLHGFITTFPRRNGKLEIVGSFKMVDYEFSIEGDFKAKARYTLAIQPSILNFGEPSLKGNPFVVLTRDLMLQANLAAYPAYYPGYAGASGDSRAPSPEWGIGENLSQTFFDADPFYLGAVGGSCSNFPFLMSGGSSGFLVGYLGLDAAYRLTDTVDLGCQLSGGLEMNTGFIGVFGMAAYARIMLDKKWGLYARAEDFLPGNAFAVEVGLNFNITEFVKKSW